MPLAELLIVLFACLLTATPFLTLALLAKHRKLREQFDQFKDDSITKNSALQREIAELKRQIAAIPHETVTTELRPVILDIKRPVQPPAPPAQVTGPVSPAQPAPPIVKETPAPVPVESHEPVKPRATEIPPVPEKKPAPLPEKPPQVTIPVAAPPKAPTPATPPSAVPVAPPEQKPVLPAAAKTPAEIRPPEPKVPAQPPAPSPAQVHLPAASHPATPPSAATSIPPAAAARISTPAPTLGLRVPAPKPTLQQRMKTVSAIEETLGTNWLQKIGIIILVIGVAMFGVYELNTVGPAGKVTISYLASALLLGGGIFLEKRERYRLLGRTGIGGGWALFFFSTFGLYHVEAMRVLKLSTADLTFDCILMLAVAVGMALHTLRYRSQLVTGLAFLLGYTTVALSQDHVYSLSAGVFLAIGLVAIVLKMGWFELEVFGILSSYLNHLYWLYRILGSNGAQGHPFPEYHASLALLFFYWATFRFSYVARRIKSDFEEHVSTVAAVLNMFLLLGVMKFQSVQPQLAYLALLVIGALEFGVGQLPITKRRREAFVVLSVAGAILLLASPFSHYSGNNLAILWLVGAQVFLAAGIIVKEVVFRRIGLCTGLLAAAHLAIVDFRQLIAFRESSEKLALEAGVLFSLSTLVFYLNSIGIAALWRDFFEDSPENPILIVQSYAGAFSAGAAIWALFAHDWTAVAFAVAMLTIAALCRRVESPHLQFQYVLLGAATLFRAYLFNLHLQSPAHTHIPSRLITLPILGAAFYLTAKFSALRDDEQQRAIRGLFAFIGTALFALLIWFEVPELWQPLAFIAFAVILSEAGKALNYRAVAWHSHLLSLVAIFTAVTVDNTYPHLWHGIPVRAFAAVPVVAGCYLLAKRLGVTNPDHLRIARLAYTWTAAGLMVWIIDQALHAPWVAVGLIIFAVVLAFIPRWIRYQQLAWQASAVSLCAFFQTFTYNLTLNQPLWPGVSLRLFTVGVVILGAYLLAKVAADSLDQFESPVRNLYTWIAGFFVGFLIWYEAPAPWIAVYFVAVGIVLALIGRRWNLSHLGFQEHLFAIAAVVRLIDFNYYLTKTYANGHISLRLITVSLVAAGLYAISRNATDREAPYAKFSAYLHTTTATALLAFLMWYEASSGWLAPLWALFAFVLAIIDRRFELDELRWQAHALSVLALVRCVAVNLYVHDTWKGIDVRLLSIAIVAVIFYALSRLIRMPQQWRDNDFHHIYSWSASTLISLMLWYELKPLSIAIGWAVFGLVLFEYGLLRKIPQFRYQAFVALVASFVRIFFANLTVGEPGEFWGPKTFTILPLIMIFFFVYAQLPVKESAEEEHQHSTSAIQLPFDSIVAYLGTATVAALFYFQVTPEWVVTSYAALAFVLFACALLLNRSLFLHQGMLLTLGVFVRGMAHNLFGSGYFSEGDWRGRYAVLGSAVAILLASLFFAFRLRNRYEAPENASAITKLISFATRRPEQLQFFIPVTLLTFMLAMKMRSGMVTVAWGFEGVLIILLALAVKERSFRLTGLGMLLLCVGKVMVMDAWGLQPRDRYITFIIIGAALLMVSFLYSRYRDAIRQFL